MANAIVGSGVLLALAAHRVPIGIAGHIPGRVRPGTKLEPVRSPGCAQRRPVDRDGRAVYALVNSENALFRVSGVALAS